VFTYLSYLAVIVAWIWIFRTRAGLSLRSVGERPETSFARGLRVNALRYFYTGLGGSLVGLAGAAYTLNITPTWTESAISGNGWIALAIVIFGGWYPVRIAFGVYLVASLRTVVTGLQTGTARQGIELLNTIPWLLMIATLFVVSSPYLERVVKLLPARIQPLLRSLLRAKAPAALGTTFDPEMRR
jgi:general nucleoside transport system permease protein